MKSTECCTVHQPKNDRYSSDVHMSFDTESMVCVYHCYNTISDAVIGEVFPCNLKMSNPEDHFTIAVCKHGIITGRVGKVTFQN